jgi:CopG family transcriptional regulator, nickel-responsive regulator
MQRVTVTLDRDLVRAIDDLATLRGYAGRSEAMRDLIRRGLGDARRQLDPHMTCVATLSFVVDAGVRELGQRLADAQRRRHDLVIAQMQVPLDHDTTLHSLVVRGSVQDVLEFADEAATQRGVRHDSLSIIPARIESGQHQHGRHVHRHEHIKT